MKRWLKIVGYLIAGLLLLGLGSTFFLDKIIGNRVEFRLLNKLPQPVYVLSDAVDLSQQTLNEALINGELYQVLHQGNEVVLIHDYHILNPQHVTEYRFNSPHNSVTLVIDEKKEELFMTDIKKYTIRSENGRKIFIREIVSDDIKFSLADSSRLDLE